MSTPWFARRRRATQHLWRGRRRPAPRRVVASAQQPRRARRGRPQPPPRGISTCLPPPSRAGPGTDSLLHLRRGTQHDRWRCAMRRAHPDLPCSGRRHVMARRHVCDAREASRRRAQAARTHPDGSRVPEPVPLRVRTVASRPSRLTGVRCGRSDRCSHNYMPICADSGGGSRRLARRSGLSSADVPRLAETFRSCGAANGRG